MKNTWLYKKLEYLHKEIFVIENVCKSGLLSNILNFIIIPIMGIFITILGLLSILLLPLYLIKDLYDLHYYLNAEKIAKKEAIKKALEFKNKIENWIDNYQKVLIYPYMLEKITYEKKAELEQLPGVNAGYKGGCSAGEIFFSDPPYYIRSSVYQKYKNSYDEILKKELLSKEFINSKHSKFEDFIIEFFKQYNNECNTVSPSHSRHICDTNRRRSLHDIYLITKHYYPEVTFIDIIKTIVSLLKINVICGSYCSTVNKYVFYTPSVSNHNSFGHTLEYTNEITFNDLKKYIEDEK